MRLSKFLSLSVAMSRNQAKFFIRKGRLSVDGTVVTDPEFDLVESNRVVFDGKPIAMAGFQYIVLHKPLSYACVAKGSEPPSVLTLLNADSDERYFYYANVLGPDATGLVSGFVNHLATTGFRQLVRHCWRRRPTLRPR